MARGRGDPSRTSYLDSATIMNVRQSPRFDQTCASIYSSMVILTAVNDQTTAFYSTGQMRFFPDILSVDSVRNEITAT